MYGGPLGSGGPLSRWTCNCSNVRGFKGGSACVKGGGALYLWGISFTKGGGVQYRNISISLSITILIIKKEFLYLFLSLLLYLKERRCDVIRKTA